MKSSNIERWVHALTLFALLAGVIVVIFELRLNREAIEANRINSGYGRYSTLNMTLMGESPAEVLAKACESPNELTTAEFFILDAYFFELMTLVRAERVISIVHGTGDRWKEVSQGPFAIMFRTIPGRVWWGDGWGEPEISTFGNEILAQTNWLDRGCQARFDDFRARIKTFAAKINDEV